MISSSEETLFMNIYKPDYTFEPWKESKLKVIIFGRNSGITNWRRLFDKTDPRKDPTKKLMAQSIADALAEAGMRTNRTNDILVPNTSAFNALVCKADELTELSRLDQLNFWRGATAEGTAVPKGKVFASLPADCYTVVVLSESGTVIAFHCGGKSTYDDIALRTGGPKRKFESVVDAVIDTFLNQNDNINGLKVFMVCGISSRHFRIDIPNVAREQFTRHGVPAENFFFEPKAETYDSMDSKQEPRLWSHERAKDNDKKLEAKICRNIVLVTNP